MKISIISDLHLDVWESSHPGYAKNFLLSMDDSVDVHVIAGDVCNGPQLEAYLGLILGHLQKPVVYVLGNHEYHHSSDARVSETISRLKSHFSHFHPLENSSVLIDNQRFMGATLWYPVDYVSQWIDFRNIQEPAPWDWVHKKAKESANWLRAEVRPGDIVVTHMLPHYNSISPKYAGTPTNKFFVHPIHDVVRFGGARLWVHGHTHEAVEHRVGETLVVCNPHGYPGESKNLPRVVET